MRGATSPRLLLELMCAQVLLPAATTDEKSLLARLERLESGGRGTPAPLPQSPPSPPHSGTNDFSERTRVPAPPDRKAAKPPESAAPAKASPAEASPANASPANAGTANASPPTPAAEPTAPASAPPAAAAAGSAPADSLRQNWGAVLDAVKRERRVAWILLSNASVLSLEDGMLTLGFPRDGDLKGFTTSGCDADLKRVLSTGFGLNVTVKGVTGVDPGVGQGGGPARPVGGPAGPGPVAAGGASDPVAAAPARSRPRHAEPPPDDMASDDLASDEFAPDGIPPDEPDGDQAPVVPELTGMDLIQRELGGQVIGEIED
jgi:DNA polymerase-3 subunit gamma/tau